MFNHFTFQDNSNPYITRTPKAFFEMLCKYQIEQIAEHSFTVVGELPRYEHDYKTIKYIVQGFAIDWQHKFSELNYSYGDLSDWQEFFTIYGKRFGLLQEFHENAIC